MQEFSMQCTSMHAIVFVRFCLSFIFSTDRKLCGVTHGVHTTFQKVSDHQHADFLISMQKELSKTPPPSLPPPAPCPTNAPEHSKSSPSVVAAPMVPLLTPASMDWSVNINPLHTPSVWRHLQLPPMQVTNVAALGSNAWATRTSWRAWEKAALADAVRRALAACSRRHILDCVLIRCTM